LGEGVCGGGGLHHMLCVPDRQVDWEGVLKHWAPQMFGQTVSPTVSDTTSGSQDWQSRHSTSGAPR